MPVVMRAEGDCRGTTVVRARANSASDAAIKAAAEPKAMKPGTDAVPQGAASGTFHVSSNAATVQTGGRSIHFMDTTLASEGCCGYGLCA